MCHQQTWEWSSVVCFQVIRLPWNKTVNQGGLASLASSIVKQLHVNVSTVSMEVITSNKGGLKILLNGYMYTKKVTRLTGIWWSCVCARTLGRKGTVKTSLVVETPRLEWPTTLIRMRLLQKLLKLKWTWRSSARDGYTRKLRQYCGTYAHQHSRRCPSGTSPGKFWKENDSLRSRWSAASSPR